MVAFSHQIVSAHLASVDNGDFDGSLHVWDKIRDQGVPRLVDGRAPELRGRHLAPSLDSKARTLRRPAQVVFSHAAPIVFSGPVGSNMRCQRGKQRAIQRATSME